MAEDSLVCGDKLTWVELYKKEMFKDNKPDCLTSVQN